ncbi:MAG: hypothetical protein KKD90_00165 [Candidatus Omnitrophica bacterium]|nr:hypothetical protein [Candidatus Omnitrophota bacterium]MBU4148863.1 hypothetical protein [Candidatus Omnitrophota bacterium]
MKKIIYFFVFLGVILFTIDISLAGACKVKCGTQEGVICLKRGPCEPANDLLLEAAKKCKEGGPVKYIPMARLSFVDILFQVLRLDRELPSMDNLTDIDRYNMESRLLSGRGIGIFSGKNTMDPLTREEFATVLKGITVEKNLGYSSGLANQVFGLANDGLVIYEAKFYVDEGKGFEEWARKQNFEQSLLDSRHYVIKLDSCGEVRVVLGDDGKGKIPVSGSKLKASYKIFGRGEEFVTECEVVQVLSNSAIASSLRKEHNPSRVLTRANFADLLIRTMHLEKQLPEDCYKLNEKELYLLESGILSKQGIDIFIGGDPAGLLTREELARVLYDYPVEEVIGVSDGKPFQSFELNNAGFIIYDLTVSVDEGARYDQWNKKDSLMESSSASKDYLVKLDSGNYANVNFGDGVKGKAPAINSPVKARYRLYAPVNMLNEDDVICIISRYRPVAETYTPPTPYFE